MIVERNQDCPILFPDGGLELAEKFLLWWHGQEDNCRGYGLNDAAKYEGELFSYQPMRWLHPRQEVDQHTQLQSLGVGQGGR